jgi:hypothetical protein
MNGIRCDADSIARDQFAIFDTVCSEIAIPHDARRRVLHLSAQEWSAWQELRRGGPAPPTLDVAAVLLRLGQVTHRLSVMADRSPARPSVQ